MSLINSKPRFGYDDKEDTIFDYLTSRSVKVGESFDSVDGTWDSVELKRLISTGQDLNEALVKDQVDRADGDFDSELKAAQQRQKDAETEERQRQRDEQKSRDAELAEQRQRATEERRAQQEEQAEAARLAAEERAQQDETARLEAEERARQEQAAAQGAPQPGV
jgi:hypothetical protein